MAIKDRTAGVPVGTKLWAKYKGQVYTAAAISLADANGNETVAYRLDPDGPEFKSLSSLGSAVRGGKATNGWDFWSIGVPMTPEQEPKPKAGTRAKCEKSIPRKPNGDALPIVEQVDGSFECGECGQSFPSESDAKTHLEEAHPAAC